MKRLKIANYYFGFSFIWRKMRKLFVSFFRHRICYISNFEG